VGVSCLQLHSFGCPYCKRIGSKLNSYWCCDGRDQLIPEMIGVFCLAGGVVGLGPGLVFGQHADAQRHSARYGTQFDTALSSITMCPPGPNRSGCQSIWTGFREANFVNSLRGLEIYCSRFTARVLLHNRTCRKTQRSAQLDQIQIQTVNGCAVLCRKIDIVKIALNSNIHAQRTGRQTGHDRFVGQGVQGSIGLGETAGLF
jgi:hypothetical protein